VGNLTSKSEVMTRKKYAVRLITMLKMGNGLEEGRSMGGLKGGAPLEAPQSMNRGQIVLATPRGDASRKGCNSSKKLLGRLK